MEHSPFKPLKIVSLRIKLLLLYALMGLVAVLATSVLSYYSAMQGIYSSAPSRASNLADELAYGFEILGSELEIFTIQRMVEKSASLDGVDMVFLTDQEGRIIAHSDKNMVGKNGDLALIQKVIETNQVYNDLVGGSLFRWIRPLHGRAYTREFNDTIGVVWIELDLAPSLANSTRAVGLISIISAALVTLTIGIAYFITKTNVTDRLQGFSQSVSLMEAGDLSAKADVTNSFGSQDEISALAVHFNNMVSALAYRISFEELVTNLSLTFSSLTFEALDPAINDAIRLLSSFVDADRVYIFRLSDDKKSVDNTHEWCAQGIEPQIENLQGIPVDAIPWWMEHLSRSKEVNIPLVANLPEEASTEKGILEEQDILSALVLPMMSSENLIGFIGFDTVKMQRTWNQDEIRLLRMSADSITNAIVRLAGQKELEIQKEALAKSEARQRAFLNAVPDLIFRMNREGIFLDFTAGEDCLLYVAPANILGAPLSALLPEDVASQIMDAIDKALETSTPQLMEYSLLMDSGKMTYEARIIASGEEEVIAVVHDISEHVRLEQMKTDFINRASHELRTPLTTSLLMVDLIDGGDARPDEWKEYWDILKQELNRERQILEDVLMVGRLESGRYEIASFPISIPPILQDAIRGILPQAEIKNILLNVNIPEQLPDVDGTEEAFSHIFMNVLSNAIKFSRPEQEIEINTWKEDDWVRIQVKDNGIGIPPEDLPHLTTRFFRAANATREEIPGSGVGLFIVKSIVDDLGGRMKIESELNVGTKVSIWLPVFEMV